MQIAQGTTENERLDALNSLQIVHSERLPEYDAVVEVAAAVFNCPVALISLVGADEQWFKARYGLDLESISRDISFCHHAIMSNDLFVVPDTLADARFRTNPQVTGAPYIRFYAGCPLSLDGRNRLGTLCVLGPTPLTPSEDQLAQLRRLGTVVEGLIKSHCAQMEARSALVQAEEEHRLAAREGDLLEEIAIVSGVGGWEADLAANTVTWTGKTREIHEVGPDFVPDPDLILSFYPPDARKTLSDAVQSAIDGGEEWDVELPFVTATGRERWIRSAGRPIREQGKTVRLVGAIQDITERKLSEQAVRQSEAVHRATLEAVSEGVLLLSRSGRIEACNPAAASLLGCDPEDLKGRRVNGLQLDIQCQKNGCLAVCEPLALAAAAPEKVGNLVAKITRSDTDQPVWLRINAKAFGTRADPAFDGVVVSLTDITATKNQADTLQVIFDNLPGGLVYFDDDRRLAICNDDYQRLLQLPQHFIDERAHLHDVASYFARRGDYGPGDPDELVRSTIVMFGSPEPHIYQRVAPDGIVLEIRGTPLPHGGLVTSIFDITERKQLEEQLAENERVARLRSEELEAVLANMRQGVSVFDQNGRLILWNQQYVDICGKPEGEVRKGRSLIELTEAEKDREEFTGDVREYVTDLLIRLSSGEVVRSKAAHPGGRIILAIHAPMPGGGWIATHEDITLREQAAARISYAAHHDTLTGLANRALFNTTLVEALNHVRAHGTRSDLLLLDLDRFKPVNDRYGHDVGDELLRQVAQRLKECVRASDLVARLGGDEFAIILRGSGPNSAAEVAERAIGKLQVPFDALGQQIHISTSIGIAAISEEEAETGKIIKNADIALYEVKNSGRNDFRFFRSRKLVHG